MPGLLQSVSKLHPRVFGSREYLQGLARQRPEAYARLVDVARNYQTTHGHDDHGGRGKLMALGLVGAIEGDAKLGREAAEMVRRVFLDQPVRVGHVGFGIDCEQVAFIYDLCHPYWEEKDRQRFFKYIDEARKKNINEEPSVFHNGWYAMKMGGFIISCLATMHENPRAEPLFEEIDAEYHARAVPALKMAGAGGGFAEGYYTNYWIYDWIVACHCLKVCANIDYFAAAAEFHKNRAIAGMFEMYPTIREGHTRRPVPCGDSGGRQLHPERDKTLCARRILVSHYRDDPAHQAVHAYNQQTPRVSFDFAAYRDFLWSDPTVKAGELSKFKLSHFSPGPGFVHARESWNEDSAYLFFHCGRRFTSHQHLDNNHFLIFKYEELLGDGGAYEWNSPHGVNYYIRTIAHNSMLIHDPEEKFPAKIRGASEVANDGGQKFPWVGTPWGHNGCAMDVEMWKKNPELGETGAIIAHEDCGDYMYCAGDATKSYSAAKLECFTRQIVFLRPGTFIIFDRVRATQPHFKKRFLLHFMNQPGRRGEHWVMHNGYGQLFVQTLLPAQSETKLFCREEQFVIDGVNCPYAHASGPAPDCRMEVSPSQPAKEDYFLHVLNTTDYNRGSIEPAQVRLEGDDVIVNTHGATVSFKKSTVGGSVTLKSVTRPLKNLV
jgi:hypothetical protein